MINEVTHVKILTEFYFILLRNLNLKFGYYSLFMDLLINLKQRTQMRNKDFQNLILHILLYKCTTFD